MRISRHSYAWLVAAISLAGLWLRAPVLNTGFIVDDYAQLSMMQGSYPVARAPLDLFTFSDGEPAENQRLVDAAFFPWWSNSQLKVSLFRPLSSALMWFDRWAFGMDGLLFHLHSALWWLAMSLVWGALLGHFLPPGWALLAYGLFIVHPAHGMLLGWIANRNASVATFFGLSALWLQVRRDAGSLQRSAAVLVPVCVALALLAGEYGICVLAFGVAYELSAPQPRRVKWARLKPVCAVLVAYALLRGSLSYGTRASGMYVDPLGETLAFVRAAAARGPVLVCDLVLGMRSNWWNAGYPWADTLMRTFHLSSAWVLDLRPMRGLHLALGIAALALAAPVVWLSQRRDARLRFACWALPFSILPALGGAPESRLLLPGLFGWSVVLVQAARALSARRARPRRAAQVLGLIFVFSLLALEARASFSYSGQDRTFVPRMASAVRASILDPELDRTLQHVHDAFLVSAVDPTTTIYIPMLRRSHGHMGPTRCHLLMSTLSPLQLSRLSDREFRLAREQLNFTPPDAYAEVFNRMPLQVGQRFVTRTLRATVEGAQDGMPSVVRFRSAYSLDDPGVILLLQGASGLRSLRFPPPGHSVSIPSANFPLRLF